jgi:hypothetical protein
VAKDMATRSATDFIVVSFICKFPRCRSHLRGAAKVGC